MQHKLDQEAQAYLLKQEEVRKHIDIMDKHYTKNTRTHFLFLSFHSGLILHFYERCIHNYVLLIELSLHCYVSGQERLINFKD